MNSVRIPRKREEGSSRYVSSGKFSGQARLPFSPLTVGLASDTRRCLNKKLLLNTVIDDGSSSLNKYRGIQRIFQRSRLTSVLPRKRFTARSARLGTFADVDLRSATPSFILAFVPASRPFRVKAKSKICATYERTSSSCPDKTARFTAL